MCVPDRLWYFVSTLIAFAYFAEEGRDSPVLRRPWSAQSRPFFERGCRRDAMPRHAKVAFERMGGQSGLLVNFTVPQRHQRSCRTGLVLFRTLLGTCVAPAWRTEMVSCFHRLHGSFGLGARDGLGGGMTGRA